MSFSFSPITRRRWAQFKANKRGFWSLRIFLVFFVLALSANIIANSKPILVSFKGAMYAPVFVSYSEKTFGGDFDTEADYRDPYVQDLITKNGWMLWPPIRYSYDTINYNLPSPAPSAPTTDNPARWQTGLGLASPIAYRKQSAVASLAKRKPMHTAA